MSSPFWQDFRSNQQGTAPRREEPIQSYSHHLADAQVDGGELLERVSGWVMGPECEVRPGHQVQHQQPYLGTREWLAWVARGCRNEGGYRAPPWCRFGSRHRC